MNKNSHPKIEEIPLNIVQRAILESDAKCYKMEGLHIIVGTVDNKYHMSISHEKRYPTWDEIKYARYRLVPNDRTMALLLPPMEEYVNLHENCFQLWEIEGEFNER